jgi:glycosyltransferase involved in cell wall biosynthesis
MIIDVTRLLGRLLKGRLPTGVDRVDIEYVRHFSHRSDALVRCRSRWLFLSHNDSLKLFDILIHHDRSQRWMILKMIAWYCLFPTATSLEGRILLNISHSGLNQVDYRQKLQQYRLKPIFFIHDLIPITHPEYSRPGEKSRHHIRIKTALLYGNGIIVNSKDTLVHLESYANNHSLRMPKSVVAYLATAPLPFPESHFSMNKPYFVMLGTIEPRKNHWLMLHIWREIVEKMGNDAPLLVIIGQRGWECENIIDMLERCDGIRPYVIEKSTCSDQELSAYLTHAQALLFPSFVEGYGMPLVEALSIGTPVIASNLFVFQEIAGDMPEYLDSLDGKGWMEMIIEYSQPQSAKRLEQIGRIKNFIPPTWNDHFDHVEKFFNILS